MLSRDGYRHAKGARQGSERLDPVFDGFIRAFRAAHGVTPLWVETTTGWEGRTKDRPCLDIVIERSKDIPGLTYRRTEDPAGAGVDDILGDEVVGLDRARRLLLQAALRGRSEDLRPGVGRLFLSSFPAERLRDIFSLPDEIGCDWSRDLVVTFSSFEERALTEISESLVGDDRLAFESSLGLGDWLWQIWIIARRTVVVLVHTDEQAERLKRAAPLDAWAESFAAIASKYDEFGYIRSGWFGVRIDSKESFDRDWKGDYLGYMK